MISYNMKENSNLAEITHFISYIDQLKNVIRKNGLHDGSREENTAEHSWHAALSAQLLASYANFPVDVAKVTQMLLIHDLIEIEAGDTFVYDPDAMAEQESAEIKAADHVFGLLPNEQEEKFRSLWDEFEARKTHEAKFAKAIDRFLPIFSNIQNGGFSWLPHRVSQAQVRELVSIIYDGSTQLGKQVDTMLDEAVKQGALLP